MTCDCRYRFVDGTTDNVCVRCGKRAETPDEYKARTGRFQCCGSTEGHLAACFTQNPDDCS